MTRPERSIVQMFYLEQRYSTLEHLCFIRKHSQGDWQLLRPVSLGCCQFHRYSFAPGQVNLPVRAAMGLGWNVAIAAIDLPGP